MKQQREMSALFLSFNLPFSFFSSVFIFPLSVFALIFLPFPLLDLPVILASQTETCTLQTSHVTRESHEFGLMLPYSLSPTLDQRKFPGDPLTNRAFDPNCKRQLP